MKPTKKNIYMCLHIYTYLHMYIGMYVYTHKFFFFFLSNDTRQKYKYSSFSGDDWFPYAALEKKQKFRSPKFF
jgi:hypothetical protein